MDPSSRRAPAHVLAGSLLALGSALACGLGCGPEAVEARAIWVDDFGGEGTRRIHVYDRGQRDDFEVLGASAPQERVRLGPRGRGLVVRAGARGGAWFDLDDGRRLALLLPPTMPGQVAFSFAARGDALWWIDADDHSLTLAPLAAGLALERGSDGSVIPLRELGVSSWAVSSRDAPVMFVKHEGAADIGSFLRYPDAASDTFAIVREATASGLALPQTPSEFRSCLSTVDCRTLVGLGAGGEVAITAAGADGPWHLFDRRAPELAGELALPEALASAAAGGGLSLVQVIDRSVSVWLGPGQLFRWDRRLDVVDSVALFAAPPLLWFPVERGRGLVLLSTTGPMFHVDAERIDVVNLETTDCPLGPASTPVVSPGGRWASWTCLEAGADADAQIQGISAAVLRVSALGLERYVGVPMSTLALDDEGDLLLYSVESVDSDQVDGVDPSGRPRNLFVLSSEGVLTRIDELEPAPVPVLLQANEPSTYMQGVALD